jgi:DNA-binding transcriptional LysR family regulator
LGGRDSIGWAEAAEQKLCLLTGDMQNRRIIDGIFRSVGKAPRPVVETNSIFNLITHAALPGVASIASRQVLDLLGPPAGVIALPLTDPEARHTIGLVVADRQPLPPLPRKLLEKAPSPDEFIAILP